MRYRCGRNHRSALKHFQFRKLHNKKHRKHGSQRLINSRNTGFNRHHRRCKSNGGTWEPRNISVVPIRDHQLWHAMFRNAKPEEICAIINSTWIEEDWFFTCQRRGENGGQSSTGGSLSAPDSSPQAQPAGSR